MNVEDSRKYSIRTGNYNYLNWCFREYYLDLLENFQKNKISTDDFSRNFDKVAFIIDDFVRVLESNSIVLSPNENSLIFADLFEEILDQCETYIEIAEFDTQYNSIRTAEDYEIALEKYEMNLKEVEVDLKKSVKETYLKIQNFLKEE